MIPLDGLKVFAAALQVTENIAYYVPKNVNADQLCSLAGPGGVVEIEQVRDNRLKFYLFSNVWDFDFRMSSTVRSRR